MQVDTTAKGSTTSHSLFAVVAEWQHCWRRRDHRWVALGLLAFIVLGVRAVSNPYRLGFLSAEDPNWHSTSIWLANLVAVYNYVLPFMTVILTFDLWSSPDDHEQNRSGRVLGRLLWVQTLIGLSFAGGVTAIALSVAVAGEAFTSTALMRAIAIWGGAALLGTTTFGLVACAASLTRDTDQTMKWSMGLLAAMIVGIPLISDILLHREFGTMPMPGTPTWEQYLETVRYSTGMAVYFFSSTETFLTLETYLSGTKEITVWHVIGIWLVLAVQAIIVWLFFGVLRIVRKLVARKGGRDALA
jgi:ABC-type transport system involved in multi-copper enzyme maturation permease subunit